MNRCHLYLPRRTEALRAAVAVLSRTGISFADDLSQANTILCPVPTPPQSVPDHCGGRLVIGGNLDFLPDGIAKADLLKDPVYVAQNASVTAEAALGILLDALPCCLPQTPTLVLGWGRIGTCLTRLLRALGTPVTVCARSAEDRGMIQALGCRALAPEQLPQSVGGFRCVVNTVPAVLIPDADGISPECVLLDLASGVFLPGDRVISARGLPGKCRPESSGTLIAEAVLRHLKGGILF